MKINERSKIIIKTLLEHNTYVTASEIANLLNVSVKTITRQLSDVEKILNHYDLKLERKTSKGMRIVGNLETKNKAKDILINSITKQTHHEYSPAERHNIILSHLLKSQEPIKLLALAKLLDVTEATISNDLDKLEAWIDKMNLSLVRKPGLGIYLEGLEKDIRKAIINHIYSHIHEKNFLQLLYHKSTDNAKLLSDADKFLLDLVDKNLIQQVEIAVQAGMGKTTYNLSENAFSGLVVHLTLAVQRLLKGESIIIDSNFLTKIKAKPEFNIAKEIGNQIDQIFKIKVPDEEIAYIAMHLLGARNNYQQALNLQYNSFQFIKIAKKIIDIAEKETKLSIKKKSKVLLGLVKHLVPAATRIKLKMEIRNPLLSQMKEKYPHWMKVAKKSAKPLEDILGTDLPEAEIAYLAMHLGSALEESKHQQQNFNVLVACPTGIGTSKLLASQLKKAFTNLNIVAVVSAINIDYDFCQKENIAFIISTVPIELKDEVNLPVVVVDFMLHEEDKDNIIRQIDKVSLLAPTSEKKSVNFSLTDKLSQLNQYSNYITEILNGFFYIELININSIDKLYDKVSTYVANETEAKNLACDLKTRETKGSTIFNNLMILHTKTTAVKKLTVGIAHLAKDNNIKANTTSEKFSVVLILIVPTEVNEKALETIGYISESLVDNLNLFDILFEGSKEEIFLELEKIYTNYFNEKYKKIMEV